MSKNVFSVLVAIAVTTAFIIGSYLILVPSASYQYEPVGENITIRIDKTWNGFTYRGHDIVGAGVIEYKDTAPLHVRINDLITIENQTTYEILGHNPRSCMMIEVKRMEDST